MTAMPPPPQLQPRGTLVPRLALAVVALMVCVVFASAWLRLAQPRVACADWPACRGATALEGARAALASRTTDRAADESLGAPQTVQRVRAVHRIAATSALLLVVALVVLLLRERPRRHRLLRPALALLALALALSMLGVVTPGSRALAVLLGNLLGGFLMLAIALALTTRAMTPTEGATAPTEGPTAPTARAMAPTAQSMAPTAQAAAKLAARERLPRLARRTFWLWLVQAALGALSGAQALHLAPPLHLALAAVALPMAGVVAWSACHHPQPAPRLLGAVLLGLLPLQFALGASAAAEGAPMPWVLAHNVSAATVLGLLCALAALRSEAGIG
ncbi:MAG: COX15/CtaA family protein [Burkholderiales bacterium]|nr:COX15/CtaA family protein [Burkholderiales bacterium]